jgi:glyoxylase-like metal-dependent hydrolase (beta-lactamase superfamily II)
MTKWKWSYVLVGLSLFWIALLSACASGTQVTKTSTAKVYTLREEYANVHIVKVGKHWLMIDAGLEKSGAAYAKRIRALGLDPKDSKGLFLTHGHADHAGSGSYFKKKFKTKIYAGAGDKGLLTTGKSDKLCPTDSIARGRVKADQKTTYTPYKADVWLNKTTDLKPLTGITGSVVMMPGHTKGSMVLVIGNAAFVGDLFRGSIVGSSAVTHFYMCDLKDNRKDIAGLLKKFPKVELFFTGHFGPVTRAAVQEYLKKQKS